MNDLKTRSPIAVILLLFITCGLYGLYWLYAVSKELQGERVTMETVSPGIELLLVIVTCGLYTFFWFYKYGKVIYQIQRDRNFDAPDDNVILYVILAIFGFSPVSMAIMQASINRISEGR